MIEDFWGSNFPTFTSESCMACDAGQSLQVPVSAQNLMAAISLGTGAMAWQGQFDGKAVDFMSK